MSLVAAAFTHRGHVRPANEDCLAIGRELLPAELKQPVVKPLDPSWPCVLLADGMGGHTAGKVASRLALEILAGEAGADLEPADWERAIRSVNVELYEAMTRNTRLRGMGTTLVGVSARADRIIHFNVGDSRLYRFSGDGLQRLSQDDVPQESRRSHGITQSLGGLHSWIEVYPHIGVTPPLQPRQRLLLCSDGLTDMVSEDKILETLSRQPDAARCVAALVQQALSAGGEDNVSVVVVQEE